MDYKNDDRANLTLLVHTIYIYHEILKTNNLKNIKDICKNIERNFNIQYSEDAILFSIVQIYYFESIIQNNESNINFRDKIIGIKQFLDNEINSSENNKYKKALENVKKIHVGKLENQKEFEIYKKYYYMFTKNKLEKDELIFV